MVGQERNDFLKRRIFTRSFWILSIVILFAVTKPVAASAQDSAYGAELQEFDYPYPIEQFHFVSQGEALSMAYMDVKPEHPNGRTVVMLHGKNFCSASWDTLLKDVSDAGFRIIAPDQIGFCKSTKPEHYNYSFQQLASNTHSLLASLGITQVTIVSHSTGGMLGIRYALMYPSDVVQLAMISPIGLEDWQAKGVPWLSIDQWYEQERKTTATGIRAYEAKTYYPGTWKPAYEKWVQMYAGMFAGPGKDLVALNSARIYDMIYTQPVFYEFEKVQTPVLLLIGDKDTTTLGKAYTSPAVLATLGRYPELGKAAAKRFPHATLIEFADLGHAGWIQDPASVDAALIGHLIGNNRAN